MAQERELAGNRPDVGVDASPAARPGVPMYARGIRPPEQPGGVRQDHPSPPGASGTLPRQGEDPRHLKRLGLKRLTPVYGTANPPHGVAGALRRWAYGYPENLARHWMILLTADRVDVVEDRLGAVLERPLASAGFDGLGRRVHRNPFGALALAAGGLWLASRALVPGRR